MCRWFDSGSGHLFFENLLNHENITVKLGVEALERLSIVDDSVFIDGEKTDAKVIYTGALDELFGGVYGQLPYRSVSFEWKYEEIDSLQDAPVVAYPKEPGFTRITEYKKLPLQDKPGTSYAVETSLPYIEGKKMEPYYPVLTENSKNQYEKYEQLAQNVKNLIYCGRLGDFKYYNMDQALKRALELCDTL